MTEPTGAQLTEEPEAILQLLAQGGLNATPGTQALAQAELAYRTHMLEKLRTRPLSPAPDPEPLAETGRNLAIEIARINHELNSLHNDIVALGKILAERLPRSHEDDGA